MLDEDELKKPVSPSSSLLGFAAVAHAKTPPPTIRSIPLQRQETIFPPEPRRVVPLRKRVDYGVRRSLAPAANVLFYRFLPAVRIADFGHAAVDGADELAALVLTFEALVEAVAIGGLALEGAVAHRLAGL